MKYLKYETVPADPNGQGISATIIVFLPFGF